MKRARIGSENCPKCDQVIGGNDQSILCSVCELTFCKNCAKLPEDFFTLIKSGAYNLMWTCQSCKSNFPSLSNVRSAITNLDNKNDVRFGKLEHKLDNIDATINQKVKQEVKDMKQELKSDIVKEVKNTFSSQLRTELREIEDQKRRVNNVICFNIPESAKTSAPEKKEDDIDRFTAICECIEVENVQVNTCFRIGKPTQGICRPLKVILHEKRHRNKLIENAKLIGSRCEGVLKKCIIVKDLTTRQRDENKQRRIQRTNNPHKDSPGASARETMQTNQYDDFNFNNTTIISQPLLQPLNKESTALKVIGGNFNRGSPVKTSTPAHKTNTGRLGLNLGFNSDGTIESTQRTTIQESDDDETIVGGILMYNNDSRIQDGLSSNSTSH